MKKKVKDIAPGRVVRYRHTDVIVLEHRTDGVFVCTKRQTKNPFGPTNDFASSALRKYLNGTFADALTEGLADELITREVDLTALNGSKEYGSCECKVAPLTFDEIRRFYGLLPKPENWEWSVTPWSTPCVNRDDTWVVGLNTSGNVSNYYCADTYGSRPAFLLRGDVLVDDLGPIGLKPLPFCIDWAQSRAAKAADPVSRTTLEAIAAYLEELNEKEGNDDG